MIGCSFDTLDPLTAGIEFNTVSKSINKDQVFTSGRYFVGLGKAFLEFPRSYQNIDFSSAPDADEPPLVMERSQVSIDCSLQYTLILRNLTSIYAAHELRYHDKMVKEATNAIKNVASDYEPTKFYQDRRNLAMEMKEAVTTALRRENAIVHDFQLRKVSLKPQNDIDVIRKVVLAEEQRTALNIRQKEDIIAATTVIAGIQDQLISIFQSEKQRNATIILENANAKAKEINLKSQTNAYEVLRASLGFSRDELLQYLWIQQLRNMPASSNVFIGFDDVVVS